MQAPKAKPRFLPTLTEVVKPVALVQEDVEVPPSEPPAPAPLSEDALVAAVMQQLMPTLELQVQNALRQSLQAQWDRLLPAVMQDLEAAVRTTVKAAASQAQDSASN